MLLLDLPAVTRCWRSSHHSLQVSSWHRFLLIYKKASSGGTSRSRWQWWTQRPPFLSGTGTDEPLARVSDYLGRPVCRSTSGGWRSAVFIVVAKVANIFAFMGVSANLITYLTWPLAHSNAAAAAAVNAWSGTASLTPLFSAFVADSWLGRYRSIQHTHMHTLRPRVWHDDCSVHPPGTTHAATQRLIFLSFIIAIGFLLCLSLPSGPRTWPI